MSSDRRHGTGFPSASVPIALIWMALLCAIHFSPPALAGSEDDIRQLIGATWDKPGARVETDPVVVEGDHAVASWTQGDRGGRALLRMSGGRWSVAMCSGEPFKHASGLIEAGVLSGIAEKLAAGVTEAEARVEPKRRALFATFEGVMHLDGPGGP